MVSHVVLNWDPAGPQFCSYPFCLVVLSAKHPAALPSLFRSAGGSWIQGSAGITAGRGAGVQQVGPDPSAAVSRSSRLTGWEEEETLRSSRKF